MKGLFVARPGSNFALNRAARAASIMRIGNPTNNEERDGPSIRDLFSLASLLAILQRRKRYHGVLPVPNSIIR